MEVLMKMGPEYNSPTEEELVERELERIVGDSADTEDAGAMLEEERQTQESVLLSSAFYEDDLVQVDDPNIERSNINSRLAEYIHEKAAPLMGALERYSGSPASGEGGPDSGNPLENVLGGSESGFKSPLCRIAYGLLQYLDKREDLQKQLIGYLR
ncbi:hypothetical protein JW711_00040 [Candidatus Woesearchaeota archaeon]|nr:hypothetical protein [Candidatus Woesearchaeota archaeon]